MSDCVLIVHSAPMFIAILNHPKLFVHVFLFSWNIPETNSTWCFVSAFLTSHIGGVWLHTSSTPFSYSLSPSSSYPHAYHFLLPILNSCSSVSHSCIKNNIVIKTTCTLSINAQHIPTVVHIPYRTFCCRDAHLQLSLYCLITLHWNNIQLTDIFHKLLRCLFFLDLCCWWCW